MYIICRVDRMPYMLIDFSDAIQVRTSPVMPSLPPKALCNSRIVTKYSHRLSQPWDILIG